MMQMPIEGQSVSKLITILMRSVSQNVNHGYTFFKHETYMCDVIWSISGFISNKMWSRRFEAQSLRVLTKLRSTDIFSGKSPGGNSSGIYFNFVGPES